jgi:hypothetical protein
VIFEVVRATMSAIHLCVYKLFLLARACAKFTHAPVCLLYVITVQAICQPLCDNQTANLGCFTLSSWAWKSVMTLTSTPVLTGVRKGVLLLSVCVRGVGDVTPVGPTLAQSMRCTRVAMLLSRARLGIENIARITGDTLGFTYKTTCVMLTPTVTLRHALANSASALERRLWQGIQIVELPALNQSSRHR